jgi:hypothetical protein
VSVSFFIIGSQSTPIAVRLRFFSLLNPDPFGLRKRVFLRCLEALAQIFALVYALTGFQPSSARTDRGLIMKKTVA